MRRLYLLASVLAVTAGSLSASSVSMTCSLNVSGVPGVFSGVGSVGCDGCFSTLFSTVPSLLSINWAAPVASGGLGPALLSGGSPPVPVTTPVPASAKLTNGDPVQVNAGATTVTRVDDLVDVYEGSVLGWNSALYAGVANFGGHFNSASSTSSPQGDGLIEVTSGTQMGISLQGKASAPVYGMWFEIASLNGINSTFVASVSAFDVNGMPIGTYSLTESGSYGSGGACPGLTISGQQPLPVPCNDAPYVGFYDPEGRINSVYISVYSGGANSIPIGFAIDSLYVDEVSLPEPAIPLLIGSGLAALALYRRKRHARVG